MADTDVGKKVTLHQEGQDARGELVAYEAGRDQGDHYCAGFSTPAMKEGGRHGDVWSGWFQVGTGPGQITIH